MRPSTDFQGQLAALASTSSVDPALVGTVSEDRSAVIGHDSWCFIYEGSSNYHTAYKASSLAALGPVWAGVVEARQRAVRAEGAEFLQFIVPNKATILPLKFPEPLPQHMTFLLDSFLAQDCDAPVLCPVDAFRAPACREAVFRRNDSHLTLAGNIMGADLVLQRLGLPGYLRPEDVSHSRVSQVGDLGGKFEPGIPEDLAAPGFDAGLLDERSIQMTEHVQVAGHHGTRQVFVNRTAPIDRKLVVFGDSFCERMPSWGMSPFFAALFQEYHFVWSNKVNIEYVRQVRPDYVVAQTCERFMILVPEDNLAAD